MDEDWEIIKPEAVPKFKLGEVAACTLRDHELTEQAEKQAVANTRDDSSPAKMQAELSFSEPFSPHLPPASLPPSDPVRGQEPRYPQRDSAPQRQS